jgi:hypothetical protein
VDDAPEPVRSPAADKPDPMTDTTVIKADPTARRVLWAALAACAALMAVALLWLPSWLRALVDLGEHQPDLAFARMAQLLRIVTVLSVALPALLGALLLHLGVKIHRSGQYPYPAMRPLRDTPLVTGAAARRRAQAALAAGALLLAAAPVIAWYLRRVVGRLLYLLS